MSGQLTYSEFLTQAVKFYESSTKLGDEWQLMEHLNSCQEPVKFLSKRCYNVALHNDYEVVEEEMLFEEEKSDISIDEAEHIVENTSPPCLCVVEYNVIYSASYSVPVLYINAQHNDGRLLDYSEITRIFSSLHRDCMKSRIWTTLTQVEHPVVQTPTYMLHPCRTGSLMASALPRQSGDDSSKANDFYLLQWLSSVGPAVGLDIPCGYMSSGSILVNPVHSSCV